MGSIPSARLDASHSAALLWPAAAQGDSGSDSRSGNGQQTAGRHCTQTALLASPPNRQPPTHTHLRSGKRYGTTAVCALRVGNTLYVAHAGDSRAVSGGSVFRVCLPAVHRSKALRQAEPAWHESGHRTQVTASAAHSWEWRGGRCSSPSPVARYTPPLLSPRQILCRDGAAPLTPARLTGSPDSDPVPRGARHHADPRPQARLGARGAAAHREPRWAGGRCSCCRCGDARSDPAVPAAGDPFMPALMHARPCTHLLACIAIRACMPSRTVLQWLAAGCVSLAPARTGWPLPRRRGGSAHRLCAQP